MLSKAPSGRVMASCLSCGGTVQVGPLAGLAGEHDCWSPHGLVSENFLLWLPRFLKTTKKKRKTSLTPPSKRHALLSCRHGDDHANLCGHSGGPPRWGGLYVFSEQTNHTFFSSLTITIIFIRSDVVPYACRAVGSWPPAPHVS